MVGKQFLGTGADAVHLAWRLIKGSAYLLFSAFLVLFFFFFFCISYETVLRRFTNMIPKWKRTRVLSQVQMMDRVIAGFVRGRLTIMLILMGLFTIGYLIIGVPAALIVGPIVGLLAIVPYLGLVSIPLSMGLMALDPGGAFAFQQSWWWIVLAPIGLYVLIQGIDDYVLNPLIQGKATEMDTPSILFAVLAGGVLAGFYGVLLAIPAAACIKIVLRESFWPRFEAWADGKVKDFLPISKYDPTETKAAAPAPNGTPAGPQVGPAPVATSSAS
jgi:predicted PurR-regulated permease PerM